jgi:hypothetical protein
VTKTLLVCLTVVMLIGCASNVVTDHDSGVVFGNYDSWDFAPSKKEGSEYVSLDGSRIRSAIDRELGLKAMGQLTTDAADLLVDWRIETEARLERRGAGFGFGGGNFGWAISAPPPIEQVNEGKLVIELVDSQTKRVVWRAASRRYLNEDQSSETRRELIDKIVADMFKEYPPGV